MDDPSPDDRNSLLAAGVQQLQTGQLDAAEGHFKGVLALDPNDADALHLLGLARHRAGHLQDAVETVQRAVDLAPSNVGFLNNLGLIRQAAGQPGEALDCFRKIADITPDAPEIHINLGNALKDLGQPEDAMASYRKALALKPDYPEAHFNLATVQHQTDGLEDALQSYDRALALKPNFPQAVCNRGNVLKDLGRLEDAVESYRTFMSRWPDFARAEAHVNLGDTLRDLGRMDEAIDAYRRALALESGFAPAHNNLGNALREQGKPDEAIASLREALAIEPDLAEAHSNLGLALQDLGQRDEAVASLRQAINLKPDSAEAHYNLGIAFKDLGRLEDAVASYRKAIDLKPDYAEPHNTMSNVFTDLGRLEDAVASYHKALAIKPDYVKAGRNLLYVMLNVPGLSPKELFTEHLRFSETHARGIARPAEDLSNDPTPDRRLRVGYLSSDFRNHPVGINVLPLISSHDRAEFEVFCYADVPRPDAMTERFRSSVDHWRAIVGKPDSEVATMVRADAIDVLVCLAGRFDRNRPLVCAHRAAPVQVSFHDGATSGLEEMDYWLTDDFLHPPDTEEMFTEELHRLPVFYQYPPITEAPTVETLPADHAGFVTFGSFNNPAKVNEDVIRLWAEVLKSVPGSKVLLKYKNWYDQASLQGSVVEKFTASGIEHDRVMFEASFDTFAQHLGRYGGVDIALDPFPFNGATTTFQALWMGVPVVSLAGETFISRMSGSILHHAGLGDLAVDTPEAYVASARDLAGDLARLRTLRANLRDRMVASPLCNAPDYARSVETAYRDMWRKWCAEPKNIP